MQSQKNTLGRIARVVQATQTAALLMVVLGAAVLAGGVVKFREADRWVDHTYDVIEHINTLRASVLRGGLSLRNYAIAPRPEFLDRLQEATTESAEAAGRLEKVVNDNPTQTLRAQEAASETLEILGWYRSSNVIARRDGVEALQRSLHERVNIDASKRLRELLGALEHEEQRLLAARRADRDATLHALQWWAAAALSAYVAFIIWTLAYSAKLVGISRTGLERLQAEADRDLLTGLANRRGLERRVAEVEGSLYSVLVFDLDDFKPVNDHHGHSAGDQVLKTVAERLLQQCRGDDLVARVGGDEFVVLLPKLANPERVAVIAARIDQALQQPIAVPGAVVTIGASIGYAVGAPGRTFRDLAEVADDMSYAEKKRRKQARPG
ncbi:diguanylate cyclase (GGDEF) domain-containing protein [Roseateles sp. YR242]|uniref:diguanylate cyclase domain-containing protein n=1 Tax=Roseateles sp. YR242 TaxID=1855305 RepID=UPI0008B411F9|nr:diguanylate cyclase [Roseateles sp. YR242]SEK23311.1 diguanylate cyclase (GGDEF) domain-containing protein [Roseateles sp. YR242]